MRSRQASERRWSAIPIAAGALLACVVFGPIGAQAVPAGEVPAANTEAAVPDARSTRTVRAAGTQLEIEVVGIRDPARVGMLQRWAEEAARATMVGGRFPLRRARVRISEVDGKTGREAARRDPSPVPWGQTSRRDVPTVLLYVRRDAGYAELRADWTAVHEFSHLFHPYLGDDGRWMAEGLASYFQNVLRARAGLLDPDEAWRRLDAGFRRGEASHAQGRLDALGRGGTMRVYWAGAAYWLEMDLALRREHGTTLLAVLDRYARCCLDGGAYLSPHAFATELDRLAGTDLFLHRYQAYAAMTEFPPLGATYRELGIEREGGELRLNASGRPAALRAAIASPPVRASRRAR